jgi:glycosyltransferase A (GT-A) superfamily protein (DUF2064 family)
MPEPHSRSATLVVFCRRPQRGIGKRRLAREVGEAKAFTISELLLAAALEDAAGWPGPRVIAPSEGADAAWAQGLHVPRADVVVQPEGNLGARLAAVDRDLRARGHSRLVYIGSDAPVLGSGDYRLAREALDTHDVVLGPALDGGVTCMGSRLPWPPLVDLPWSSEHLHAALEAACRAGDLTVRHLPPRYDVDVAADLRRLAVDLKDDTRPARRALYRALTSLGYCRP